MSGFNTFRISLCVLVSDRAFFSFFFIIIIIISKASVELSLCSAGALVVFLPPPVLDLWMYGITTDECRKPEKTNRSLFLFTRLQGGGWRGCKLYAHIRTLALKHTGATRFGRSS